jgi:Plavaka transposase
MAFPDNLDAGGPPRSREHLEILFEETIAGIMWDQYGVVGDVLVRFTPHFFQANVPLLQPFTYHFPRADIYELLAPDLLHQLIKGAFKDHLVAWVEQYLETMHGSSRAQEIMDDIDKRCVAFTVHSSCSHTSMLVFQSSLPFHVSADFLKVAALSSGLEMIRKC